VQNLWYATDDNGVAALVYAPSEVTVKVSNGVQVCVKEDTGYPFEERVRFQFEFVDKKIKKSFFPFHFRIPAWCTNPVVFLNGQVIPVDVYSGEIARINREWVNGDVLSVELPMHVDVSYWFDGAAVIERGPLLYSLKMEEKWEKKPIEKNSDNKYGNWYYEVTSNSPWNYSLLSNSLKKESIGQNFVVEKKSTIASYPWNTENAPITIRTKARRIPGWQLYRGSTGSIPFFTQQGKDYLVNEEAVELIPYGCTTLRITEFPIR